MNDLIQDFTDNIAYCIHVIGCNTEQTDELIGAADNLGVSAQYFCEEFIFVDEEGEAQMQWHDDDHLNIAEFNAMYWEGN